MVFVILIILLNLIDLSVGELCDTHDLDKYSCYDNQTNLNVNKDCKNVNNNTVKWSIIDKQRGIAELEFYLDLECKCNQYYIELFIDENITSKENCINNSNLALKLHSEFYYKRKNIREPFELLDCKQNAKVNFSYIFNGCYTIKISKFYYYSSVCESLGDIRSVHFLNNFEYKKTSIQPFTIPLILPYRKSDSVTFFTVKIPHENFNEEDIIVCKLGFIFTNYKLLCIDMEYKLKKNLTVNICSETETKYVNITATVIDNFNISDVEFKIYGFPEEDFSVVIIFSDFVRCSGKLNTIWQNNNCFSENTNIKRVLSTENSTFILPLSEEPSPFAQYKIHILITGVILLTVFSVILVIILYKHNKISKNKYALEKTVDVELDDLNETIKIFLLYPRDNKVFMDTMTSFRNLLKCCTHLKVLDVYDPTYFDELDEAPDSWIRDILTNENTKTILVLTQCANLLSQIDRPVPYKDQECYDSLYPLAVKCLYQNEYLMSYEKLFLVHFNFDNTDYKSFKLFTPNVRYGLPCNLKKLITNLNNKSVDENFEHLQEYNNFLKLYNYLEIFVKQNPNYLSSVLNIDFLK